MYARLFIFLIVGHCIGDWWLQTSEMAINKVEDYRYLIEHCLVYAVCISLCSYYVTGDLVIFISVFLYNLGFHILFDMKGFEKWWLKIFVLNKGDRPEDWLVFVIDQTFHFVSIVVLLEILTKFSL